MTQRQEINRKLSQIIDSVLLGAVLLFSHTLRAWAGETFASMPVIPPFREFYWLFAIVVLITPVVLEYHGFYDHPLRRSLKDLLPPLFQTLLWMGLIVGGCVIFLKWSAESRAVVLLFVAGAGMALVVKECLVKQYLLSRMRREDFRERVLLAGGAEDMDQILASLPSEQRLRLEIVGRVDLTRQGVADLIKILHEQSVERVIFAADHVHFRRVEEAINACETEGVEAWLAADFMQTTLAKLNVEDIGGVPMLVFRSTPDNGWALMVKNATDRVLAFALIIATAPLWLLTALAIRLAAPGPILFRQLRGGRYGKPFMMYKFRTMYEDAEQRRAELEAMNQMTGGPAFKVEHDPRIFPLGRLLRKLSIDELPQLWNVVKGEMSLVGPRPLPVYEVEKIENSAQRRRLSVKPGLTCLWQISGRNQITDFAEWVRLDLEYIDNWSLWLDWKILARTVPAVLLGLGAR